MSRIGRSPITVPSGVNIDVKDGTATVKGPKGTVTAPVPHNFEVEINDGVMTITRPSDNKEDRARHGLTRALMSNAVVGVSEGFTKVLELRGVGYRAEVAGQTLKLALGYSHPVDLAMPKEITAAVTPSTPTQENGLLAATITLQSWDKQALGDFAADAGVRVADRALFLHGAIGYTWEHDLQFLFKRAKSGALLFGSAQAHRERICSELGLAPAVDVRRPA